MLACDVGDLNMVDLLLRSNADSDLPQPVGTQSSYYEGCVAGYKLQSLHVLTVEPNDAVLTLSSIITYV